MARADTFTLELVYDIQKILENRGLEEQGRVQKFIDSTVLELCEPYVPKDVGGLILSGKANTQIGTGRVRYRTPYARRWYYRPANFQQGSGGGMNSVGRGNYWFERMKREHLGQILEGAKKEAGVK